MLGRRHLTVPKPRKWCLPGCALPAAVATKGSWAFVGTISGTLLCVDVSLATPKPVYTVPKLGSIVCVLVADAVWGNVDPDLTLLVVFTCEGTAYTFEVPAVASVGEEPAVLEAITAQLVPCNITCAAVAQIVHGDTTLAGVVCGAERNVSSFVAATGETRLLETAWSTPVAGRPCSVCSLDIPDGPMKSAVMCGIHDGAVVALSPEGALVDVRVVSFAAPGPVGPDAVLRPAALVTSGRFLFKLPSSASDAPAAPPQLPPAVARGPPEASPVSSVMSPVSNVSALSPAVSTTSSAAATPQSGGPEPPKPVPATSPPLSAGVAPPVLPPSVPVMSRASSSAGDSRVPSRATSSGTVWSTGDGLLVANTVGQVQVWRRDGPSPSAFLSSFRTVLRKSVGGSIVALATVPMDTSSDTVALCTCDVFGSVTIAARAHDTVTFCVKLGVQAFGVAHVVGDGLVFLFATVDAQLVSVRFTRRQLFPPTLSQHVTASPDYDAIRGAAEKLGYGTAKPSEQAIQLVRRLAIARAKEAAAQASAL